MKEAKFKILIVSGIFPPDIGGPAKYAKNLKEEFETTGHQVKVACYSFWERKLPPGLRHFLLFLKILKNMRWADFILALDIFSVGLPAVFAGKIFHKKTIVRVGGDFLWETYVEKTGHLIKLRDFYAQKPKLPLKFKMIAWGQKFALQKASALAFNTLWQKEFFEKIYNLSPAKTFLVENFYGKKTKEAGSSEQESLSEKIFLFAGRKIKLKNLNFLEQIFALLKSERPELKLKLETVDNLSAAEIQAKTKNAYALIVPSISEFAPNFIIEGLSFSKPFILTKECGLAEKLKEIGIFVDPFDQEDIKNKILFLAAKENYQAQKEKILSFNFSHSWRQIAEEFLAIFQQL